MPEPGLTFVWKGKQLHTIGELFNAMCAITDPGEAERFMGEYRAVNEHADQNIGYLTGYCSAEDAKVKRELFGVKHPIFGSTDPEPGEALAAGLAWGRAAREAEAS